MALIDVTDLTLNPREVETVSAVIFERAFNDSDLSEYHDVETGIDMKTQIVLGGRMGLLGKAVTGCTPNEVDGITMTEKYWDPAFEDFRLTHCQADMPRLLKLFKKESRMNPDFFDKVGSEEFGVIIAAVETAMLENMHRKIWFNDKAAALTSGGGVFKVGTDLGYWNTFDGLWKQIMADVNAGDSNYVAITKNAAASYALQALAVDDAVSILSSMYTSADERLLADPDAFFLVTRSIADNYRASLRTKTFGAGFTEVLENGKSALYFEGIEVKTRFDWDRYIRGYQDNGTKWNLPHRAILTTKSNIPVGTLSTEDLESLDVFYDRKSKENIIDAAYTIDAKHLESYLTVAAY